VQSTISSDTPLVKLRKILCIFFLLFVALCVRVLFGDAFNLRDDNEGYYLASREIVQSDNLYVGAVAYPTLTSFRWLSTWATAVSWKLFGESPFSLSVFQLLGATFLVALSLLFCSLCMEGRGLWTSGWIACFIPIGIQFAATLSPDAMMASLTGLSLYLLLQTRNSKHPKWLYLLSGAVFSLGFLTKEESAKHLLPLIVVGFCCEASSKDWKRIFLRLFIFFLPLLVIATIDFTICYFLFGNFLERATQAIENMQMWRRMGTVDPSGHPWSWTYYLRRLFFPLGPFAFVFLLVCFGFYKYWKDGRNRALLVWFALQTVILIVGGQFGQIQDRMLQVLIPVSSVLSGYALKTFPRMIKVLAVLSLLYIVLAKFDLRWDASPHAPEIAKEIGRRELKNIYANEDIRYHMKLIGLEGQSRTIHDYSQLAGAPDSVIVVSTHDQTFDHWREVEVIYDASHSQKMNFLQRMSSPLSQFRRAYPSYRLLHLERIR